MRTFMDDVKEQPDVLQRIATFYASDEGSDILQQIREIASHSYERIIFTGMGSSYAVSRLGATYLWSHQIPAMYIEASELLHYGLETLTKNALLICISQSGESIEIRQVLKAVHTQATVIGITNVRSSTLGTQAKNILPLLAGDESTTSSKTYTSTVAVTLLLCTVLAQQNIEDALIAIVLAADRYGAMAAHVETIDWRLLTEWLNTAKAIYVIGRGPAVSTAFQGGLTFKELVKVQAESMEAATFRHGPLETVDENTLIFALASEGKTNALVTSFVKELLACGAKVIVIEEGFAHIANNKERPFVDVASPKTTSIGDEFYAALLDIYPIQIAAHRLAERLERNGEFTWITKVTSKE